MSIVRVQSKIDKYRVLAKSKDLHALSGREDRKDITEFISEHIYETLSIGDGDLLADIGCGDGTFLSKLIDKKVTAIGILPTIEEVQRVQEKFSCFAHVNIKQGLSVETGLQCASVDRVVCNGVLIALSSSDEVKNSLREISRISKPGAQIYIGELPFRNEMEGKNYGNSISKWLFWVWKKQGTLAFFKRSTEVLRAIFSEKPFIIADKKHFFVEEDVFIEWALAYGFKLISCERSKTLINNQGCDSTSRNDYLFEKK